MVAFETLDGLKAKKPKPEKNKDYWEWRPKNSPYIQEYTIDDELVNKFYEGLIA